MNILRAWLSSLGVATSTVVRVIVSKWDTPKKVAVSTVGKLQFVSFWFWVPPCMHLDKRLSSLRASNVGRMAFATASGIGSFYGHSRWVPYQCPFGIDTRNSLPLGKGHVLGFYQWTCCGDKWPGLHSALL